MGAKLAGTMLEPGVSRNGRLYTPELIKAAHDRLVERLADPSQPVTMLTHHDAADDSTKIVGRVTGVSLREDGAMDFTAQLADTPDAATIGALVTPDEPFLANVSIRGRWLGAIGRKTVAGQSVETAEDLEIVGLDFTKTPGVQGATVHAVAEQTAETIAGDGFITETVQARGVFTEAIAEADTQPYGKVAYGDPGYLADKVKRYPIDTKAHAKAAWSYINQQKNASQYTGNQLKRVRGRIKAALKKFGVDMTETAAPAAQPALTGETRLGDVVECYGDTGTVGFSISAYNGPLVVNISAYNGIEPADLASVAQAAMTAAVAAIHSMDPDDDGDIDTGAMSDETAGDQPDDNQMETAPSTTDEEADMAEEKAAVEATENTDATDATETADEALTAESVQKMIDDAVAKAVAAIPAATIESTEDGEVGESAEITEPAAPAIDEAALAARIRAELIDEMRKDGTLGRKGLVENLAAQPEPEKPLHEMSEEEFRAREIQLADYFAPTR